MKTDTPRTDAHMCEAQDLDASSLVVPLWIARELERENAELRGKLAQVHKDLGCELMDPNGTIWQHAAKVQEENKELLARLAGMEEAQRDMILHGVLRNELAVILGMPAQERTRDGNNKLLMTLVDQLDAVHLMLRKATNENASLAAKLAGMEEEKARLKFYEYTNTKN